MAGDGQDAGAVPGGAPIAEDAAAGSPVGAGAGGEAETAVGTATATGAGADSATGEDGDAGAGPKAARQARDASYRRIETLLLARAEGRADAVEDAGFDPVLALNLLKLRRAERPPGDGDGAEMRRVPIAMVRTALLRRLDALRRHEEG